MKPTNYLLLPDFFAMSLLMGVLLALRGRWQDRKNMRLWVAGLLLILAECAARILYTLPATPRLLHRLSHAAALDAYLAAGVLFLLSASLPLRSMQGRTAFLVANTLPMMGMLTLYGMDGRQPQGYVVWIVLGALAAGVSCFLTKRTLGYYVALLAMWTIPVIALAAGEYRAATYVSLACVYLLCALAFRHSLPAGSRGKVAVVAGFVMWAVCFASHPWIAHKHPEWTEFASDVWNMQKFVITVGLLVVMLEQQLKSSEWLALHDELTGLPNRRCFDDCLQQALTQAERGNRRVALYALDLDGFKCVNDTFGHDAGDILLRHVSVNLENALGFVGTVARIGGDEFSLIAMPAPPEASTGDAICMAMLRAVQIPVNLGPKYQNHIVTVSTSIGVAVYPEDGTEAAALIRLADARMYAQKAERVASREAAATAV